MLRREVTVAEICLDFLLQEDEKTLYAEVKCCTLVAGCGAYLPEALSQRMEQDFRFLSEITPTGSGGVAFEVFDLFRL